MSRTCQVFACERPHRAKGYCGAHYKRARQGLGMDAPVRAPMRAEDRFWSNVDKGGPDECWIWTGHAPKGYGLFFMQGSRRAAHRISYEWKFGPIPSGKEIDHMCHNILCVNPGHLRTATKSENAQNRMGARSESASGIRGVTKQKGISKWRAEATVGGNYHYLGLYESAESAEKAVTEWRREHMPYSLMDKERKAS